MKFWSKWNHWYFQSSHCIRRISYNLCAIKLLLELLSYEGDTITDVRLDLLLRSPILLLPNEIDWYEVDCSKSIRILYCIILYCICIFVSFSIFCYLYSIKKKTKIDENVGVAETSEMYYLFMRNELLLAVNSLFGDSIFFSWIVREFILECVYNEIASCLLHEYSLIEWMMRMWILKKKIAITTVVCNNCTNRLHQTPQINWMMRLTTLSSTTLSNVSLTKIDPFQYVLRFYMIYEYTHAIQVKLLYK